MFERCLVAADLSPATTGLLEAAGGLQELGARELILIHVVKPLDPSGRESMALQERAAQLLEDQAEDLRARGLSVTVEIAVGSPSAQVIAHARKLDPSLILMGTRSRSAIREAFVGSTTWEVLRRARRPVLIYRLEPGDETESLEIGTVGRPTRVLHPTDFSDTAARALPWLRALAEAGVPSFTLLHTLPSKDPEGEEAAGARLRELADELQEVGAREVETTIRVGMPGPEIVKASGTDLDTLTVLGSHGHGFLPELVLGSASRHVIRHSKGPVLVVPAPDKEKTA